MKVHKTRGIKQAQLKTIVNFKKSFNLKNEVVPLENKISLNFSYS